MDSIRNAWDEMTAAESAFADAAWAALKAECCVNPETAVRCVLVSEESFRAAMAKVATRFSQ